jgi:hypothetical protein
MKLGCGGTSRGMGLRSKKPVSIFRLEKAKPEACRELKELSRR